MIMITGNFGRRRAGGRALTEGPRESGVAALANNRLSVEDVALNHQGRG